jgi:hypothetical protein
MGAAFGIPTAVPHSPGVSNPLFRNSPHLALMALFTARELAGMDRGVLFVQLSFEVAQ